MRIRPPFAAALLALLLAIALLGGCGQKGRLYLPDEQPPAGSTK